MNLDRRIAALEADSGPDIEPLCIFLVALGAETSGRRIVGYEAGGKTWERGGTEGVEALKARVVQDLHSMDGGLPLVATQYAEAV